jgi:hypothetical protein
VTCPGYADCAYVDPHKTKQLIKKGKVLAFPWIHLVETGLFNGLKRIQMKKSFRSPRLDRNVSDACLLRFSDSTKPTGFGEKENNSTISDFRKVNAGSDSVRYGGAGFRFPVMAGLDPAIPENTAASS